ncbi:restriction endonuclease subunit S [Aliarcobacter butzleri]|uniref:restriction endonuclease subunit S n=1 Tax=Aliarcobacter butzleri TaxID=28197 RepID=UPI0021B1EAC3|nr:restriction endonuclease subunit S [Aliarcobacter butzleri]MCT7564567.1 restriction endonuclease subunit S [Aliarcobacter butzleri]
MTTKRKVPQIRFKGFINEWDNKELTNYSSKIGDGLHGTPKYVSNTGIYFINGNNLESGSIHITDETKEVSKEDSLKNDKQLNSNTILMSINGTIGNLAWYQNETIMLGKSVAYITLKNCYKLYMYCYLQSTKISKYFSNNLTGSTIKNLGLKTIRETEISIPTEITEQKRIGNYFQQLDKFIEQKEKKYQKLKQFKKAMLDKMFPKNGADTPEIRFKGFSGKWEEKSLEEIVDRYDNLRIPISASNRIAGDTPYYGANGIQDYVQGFTHDGEFILVAEDGANDLKNYPVQYVNGKIWVNNHAHVLQAKKDISSNKFLKYSISKINIEPFLVGGGRAKLNANIMMKINIYVPLELQEQEKIGNYFQKLDSQIDLQQKELEKLKNIKKASLAKMFV